MVLKKARESTKKTNWQAAFFSLFINRDKSLYSIIHNSIYDARFQKKNVSLQRKMAKKQQGGRYFQSFKHTSQPINPKSILNQPYIKSISTLYHLYGTASVLLVYCRCTADVIRWFRLSLLCLATDPS
jgi:hypothetical protein